MIRFLAILIGIVFICAGVAGFMPVFTTNGALFGFFMVNDIHNIIHIASGVVAIMAATSFKWTKLYFLIFGIIYFVASIIGFARGDLFFMRVNTADNFLYMGFGVVSLLLWYYASRKQYR